MQTRDLTHWSLNQIGSHFADNILNAFSCLAMYSKRVPFIDTENGLAPNQAIARANDDWIYWRIYASPGLSAHRRMMLTSFNFWHDIKNAVYLSRDIQQFNRACQLAVVAGARYSLVSTILSSLQLIWRSGTRRFHLRVPDLQMSSSDLASGWDTRTVVPMMAARVTCLIGIHSNDKHNWPRTLNDHIALSLVLWHFLAKHLTWL